MKKISPAGLLLLLAILLLPMSAGAAEQVFFYHNDALGSPVAMTDMNGNVVWRADYEPFGNVSALVDNVPGGNTHQFIGKEADQETGLHYLRARYYDAGLGRFLSVDPALLRGRPRSALTIPQRLNFYGYSTNNPYRYFDPGGLYTVLVQGSFSFSGPNGSSEGGKASGIEPIARGLEARYERVERLNSGELERAVDLAVDAYKHGEAINIVGFSFGGDLAVDIARELERIGIPVNVLATIDSVGFDNTLIPGNVATNLNIFETNTPFIHGGPNLRVNGSLGLVVNTDVSALVGFFTGHTDTPQLGITPILDAIAPMP